MNCTLGSVTLNSEAVWLDELAWSDTKGVMKRTIGGKVVISTNQVVQDQGRPLTLGGDYFWITYADLLLLQGYANSDAILQYQHHDGRTFTVKFRYWESPFIDASALNAEAEPTAYSLFKVSLKLVIV